MLKYLYNHSRADAANCLLERAAFNRVPKACWLPNSSQIKRIISGGNMGAIAARVVQTVIYKMKQTLAFVLKVIDLGR